MINGKIVGFDASRGTLEIQIEVPKDTQVYLSQRVKMEFCDPYTPSASPFVTDDDNNDYLTP